MRARLAILAAPALAVLALAGCRSSGHTSVTPSASAAASIALGEALGCLQHGSFLTHSGRVQIKNCVENLVPKANRPAAAFCAGHAVLHHGHAARENALAACLTKYGATGSASPSAS